MCLDYYVMEDVYVSGREKGNKAEECQHGTLGHAAIVNNVGRKRDLLCMCFFLLHYFGDLECLVQS